MVHLQPWLNISSTLKENTACSLSSTLRGPILAPATLSRHSRDPSITPYITKHHAMHSEEDHRRTHRDQPPEEKKKKPRAHTQLGLKRSISGQTGRRLVGAWMSHACCIASSDVILRPPTGASGTLSASARYTSGETLLCSAIEMLLT